jgi:hypothetical protein
MDVPQAAISRRVAVVQWSENDELANGIAHELGLLGYRQMLIRPNNPIPDDVSTIFSYGPYGKLLSLVSQLETLPAERRPLLLQWNTEGLPDLHLPWFLMKLIAHGRSRLGRYRDKVDARMSSRRAPRTLLALADSRMTRFRWLGDYYYAAGKGMLNVLADSSALYAALRSSHGMPTIFAPWGSAPHWFEDLRLERDIDVLWMGNRTTRRRRSILERIRAELRRHGVEMYMADGEENPYIFGAERMQFLNRAKITLNVTRTWYDDNFSRFALAAPNRSLLVSEKMLPHCPAYVPGVHYVESPPEELASTLLYYLRHPEFRFPIVENAYQLMTTKLTLHNSMKTIMHEAERLRRLRSLPKG